MPSMQARASDKAIDIAGGNVYTQVSLMNCLLNPPFKKNQDCQHVESAVFKMAIK